MVAEDPGIAVFDQLGTKGEAINPGKYLVAQSPGDHPPHKRLIAGSPVVGKLSTMTLEELAEVTEILQRVEAAILQAFREGRHEDYPGLRAQLDEARARYDELAERSFQ